MVYKNYPEERKKAELYHIIISISSFRKSNLDFNLKNNFRGIKSKKKKKKKKKKEKRNTNLILHNYKSISFTLTLQIHTI